MCIYVCLEWCQNAVIRAQWNIGVLSLDKCLTWSWQEVSNLGADLERWLYVIMHACKAASAGKTHARTTRSSCSSHAHHAHTTYFAIIVP